MSRSIQHDIRTAGFTLIEVLVALSLVAITLSSIGALIATSVRATRSAEARLLRLEAARGIMTALPDRNELTPGVLTGEVADHLWRLDISPLPAGNFGPKNSVTDWVPQTIVISVQSPDRGAIEISTIRLRRKDRK